MNITQVNLMKWLFLVHQVQTPNSRERVRVWRLTKKLGTILYRNSVYVLPYNKERLEDFHWLCQQIRDSKGEASVFVSEAGDASEDRVLKGLFDKARETEYAGLEKQVKHHEGRWRQIQGSPGLSARQVTAMQKGLGRLEETFQEIRRVDFFGHPSAAKIGRRLRDIRLSFAEVQTRKDAAQKIAHHSLSEFRGRTWATRAHIHIDRLCSAWLIKRFIDPKAIFIFAPEEKLPAHALLFDVVGAEFTHRGDRCTFETLLESFRLNDNALFSLAELVHEIDLKDHKFSHPESAGLDMVVRAISEFSRNDEKTLELGSRILDAIFARFSHDT
jgi:hypothetical protein